MRVILMHNPTAGREDHSAEQLTDEITRAGHQVIAQVQRRKHLAAAIEEGCDLVAVAGGDGTVGKAARVLAGTEVPLAVLALGTANNIARTLGVRGSTAEEIAAWKHAEPRRLDAAQVTLDDDPERFIESLGLGAFPLVMQRAVGAPQPDDVAKTLDRDLGLLWAGVAEAKLVPYEVTADGKDLSGDYLMVEVLNIGAIGPNLPLAPTADPGDGKLDLVLVGEADRGLLLAGIDRIRRGEPASIGLRSCPATSVSIAGKWRRYHRDGDLREDRTGRLTVEIEPAALTVLVPRHPL